MPYRQITTYQAVISQARAYRALRNFLAHALAQHDLTMTEWLVLGTLVDAGRYGLRVSELAGTLGVEMPVVTNLINKAVASGYVVRSVDLEDKRAKRVVATLAFGEMACNIEGELRSETGKWLEGLDAETIKGYFTVVGALSDKESKIS
jgi:DNA-binding MarR family transcriptional regulator